MTDRDPRVWRLARSRHQRARRRFPFRAGLLGEALEDRTLLAFVAVTGELRVDTATADASPAVAVDALGDSVVVWLADDSASKDATLEAQRLDAAGNPVGSPILVDDPGEEGQSNPAVAMDSSGDFVVAWQGARAGDSGQNIYARRFNAQGVPGPVFRVNSQAAGGTTGDQIDPSVAMDDEGEFVVGWLSNPPAGTRTALSSSEVLAQLFSGSQPSPDGSQIDVGPGAATASRNVSVAMDEEGDFVVGFGASGETIQAQRFAAGAKGSPLPLQLAATPEPNPSVNGLNPSVAMDPEGEVAISWQREEGANYYDYLSSGETVVLARCFDQTGNAIGDRPFSVSRPSPDDQTDPATALDGSGDLTIAWQGAGNPDGSGLGIFAQQFVIQESPAGSNVNPVGSTIPVNVITAGDQLAPAVAVSAGGQAVLSWIDVGPAGLGAAPIGQVAARIYQPLGIVADPQPLTLNDVGADVQSATILASNQVDTYHFQAPVNGRMAIELSDDPGSSLDATLSALDATGHVMTSDSGASDIGTARVVTFDVVAGVSYGVQVAADPAGGTAEESGDYTLSFSTNFASTFTSALPIPLSSGGFGTRQGTIATSGEIDTFRITSPLPGYLAVDMIATPGSHLDSFLYLYNSQQTLIASNDDGGGGLNSAIRFLASAGQTYYIQAAGFGPSIGAYEVTIGPSSSGNSFADATRLTAGSDGAFRANGEIAVIGEVNIYRFQAPATGPVVVQLSVPGGQLETAVLVYDDAGNLLTLNDAGFTQDAQVEFNAVAGQTYFVQVSASPIRQFETGNPSTAVGSYRMVITPGVAGPSPNSNDQIGGASPITLAGDGTAAVSGTLGWPGQVAYYEFLAPRTGAFQVKLDGSIDYVGQFNAGGFEPLLQAYDGQGRLIATDADGAGNLVSAVTFDATAGTTYYLQVSGLDQGKGDFELTLQGPPAPDPTTLKHPHAKQVVLSASSPQVDDQLSIKTGPKICSRSQC